jgi:transcriptional regulator with XRE-family HTH domain
MERALNITKDYLHLIKNGKRRAVDPELRTKLYHATGLEIFKPIPTNLPSGPAEGPIDRSFKRGKIEGQKPSRGIEDLPIDLPKQLTFALQRLGLSISECATRYGISASTLKKYKRGVGRPSEEKNVKAVEKILKDAQITQGVLLKKPEENSFERAARVKKLLVMLADELEFFKQNSESTRETFQRVVPGEDVGYITTLLRALYDEDQFQRWLLFSKYKMKSKEEN